MPAVAALAVVLYFAGLGARDLWHPNEPTYGQAVAEMAAHGAWLVPTVNGVPFGEKPILYFWLARLFSLLTGGVSELSLRLPSALAGVASVVLLQRLVRRYTTRERARTTALVLATTYIVFWSARTIQMDLLLTACTLAAVSALAGVLDGARPAPGGWVAAGAAAGLGVLAKGPVGLICPALVVVPYALATRRGRALLQPAALAGLASCVLVAAPWYAALALRGHGTLLGELLWRQNVTRFVAPWDHAEPWWYFAGALLLDGLPWSPLLLLAPWAGARDERERRLERLAWCWLAGIVLFFSLSASKRSPYILPAMPAAAILVGALLERWRAGELGHGPRRAAIAVISLIAAALAAGAALTIRALDGALAEPAALRRVGIAGALLMVAGAVAIAGGALLPWRRRFGAALGLGGFTLAAYLTAGVALLPDLDAVKSHRPFCEAIVAAVRPGQPLYGYRLWKWRAAYSFYSRRAIPSLASPEELRAYWARPERVFLVVERDRLDEVRATVDAGPPLADRAVGSNHVYLFSNR